MDQKPEDTIGNRAFVVHVTDRDGSFLKDDSIKLARLAATRFPASAVGG